MNKENTEKLFERFSFFKPERPITEGLMAFGFECGDGWLDLIWTLCENIEKVIELSDPMGFEVIQVKEKFGGLRFYVDGGNNTIFQLINKAEEDSVVTCEECGKQPAKANSEHHWIRTLCEECESDRV